MGDEWILGAKMSRNLIIQGPNGMALVTINTETGEVTYGEGYEPDQAARIFWRGLTDLPAENERLREALRETIRLGDMLWPWVVTGRANVRKMHEDWQMYVTGAEGNLLSDKGPA